MAVRANYTGSATATATNFTAADALAHATALNTYESQLGIIRSGLINVRDPAYGAVGNGTTDDSSAFLAAFTEAASNSVTTAHTPERRGTRTIYIPAGTYLISQPEKFMADLSVAAMRGITWKGAGRDVTFLIFAPSAANQYMLRNNDDFLFLTFEDMTFHSTTATASWMLSHSTGLAQNYVFNRINWSGNWKYGVHLTGTNNNSELTWFHCGVYGNWTTYFFIPTSGASDQFLNYDFYSNHFEMVTGDAIDIGVGGNVNLFGGSYIHIGSGNQTTSAAQCFFRLRTPTHNAGVLRFYANGGRYEHRHNNSSLIKCEWERGSVQFTSIDSESHAPTLSTPTAVRQAEFGITSGRYPIVRFQNCLLMGHHAYHFNANTYNQRQNIVYDGCEIFNHMQANDFITKVNDDATGNVFSAPAIRFQNCHPALATDFKETFDCTLGFPRNANAIGMTRQVGVHAPWGGLPWVSAYPSQAVNLPLDAIIVRVRAGKGASGTSTSTNFSYTLRDGASAVIATADNSQSGGTQWQNAWKYESSYLGYQCDTNTKRQLTLTATNITENQANTYFIIEYLA